MLTSNAILQQRYQIVERIGRGGMGAVYVARDLRLGISVAVKELINSTDQLIQAFEREARTLASLHHQSLPHVTDYFEEQGSYFLVMEYIPGPDLEAILMRRSVPFPLADVLRWAEQLLDVLSYLHSRQPPILHRDIKPQNLKLTADGDLVLLDFGLARGAPMPGASLIGYTLSYAPPEQIRGEGTDPRSDLYAAAATLYHLLTLTRPPDAIRRQAAISESQADLLRRIETQNLLVPTPLATVLSTAMSLDPRERPASAAALLQLIRGVSTSVDPQAVTVATAALPIPTEVILSSAQAPALEPIRPSGTITLLFTDLVDSTHLWERFPGEMPDAISHYNEILLAASERYHGYVFKNTGDGMCAAFADPVDGLTAAIEGQRALAVATFGAVPAIPVRMALHTGAVHFRNDTYLGQPLNRIARLLNAGHGGQILVSRVTQDLVRDALPPDVTLRNMGEHRLRDLISPEQIFQVVALGIPADFPPLRTLNTRVTNLPVQPTTLVGRDEEIMRVRALLLRSDVQLVTLSGPGGTGKTRLALQVSADLLDEFTDGVFFVDLAAVRTPELLLATTMHVLGLRETDSQTPLASLKQYLGGQQILLVLDNFEQVVAAAPLVGELVTAPHVKALVTSREPLHLTGEHEFAVAPLSTPDIRRLRGRRSDLVATVAQWPAVALFVARAQAARHDFALTAENAVAVAEVCVRLDGLPLAIELAAARVKLFAPQALLARLDQRLKILTGGPRNTALRQQTLRAAIDWSYDLLDPAERDLFARLGVFVSGCSFEAAEQLCVSDSDLDILSGLDALVNKSLVRQVETTDGEPRFVLLETIREYAMERLVASGEAEALQERHAAYYLALVEVAEQALSGADQALWLDRLEDDHPNLRAAMRWMHDHKRGDDMARMAAALWVFWYTRGYLSEGSTWLQKALDVSVESTHVRARILNGAGLLAWAQGRYGQATHLIEEALACARAVEDRAGVADALNHLGLIAKVQGHMERAVGFYQESRTTYLEIGDRRRAAIALNNLGVVAEETGEYALAQQYYEENLRTYLSFGDEFGVADTQINLGFVELLLGNLARAEDLFMEGLRIHRRLGDQSGVAYALMGLGQAALARDDWPLAVRQTIDALQLFAEREDREGEARALAVLAEIATAQGRLSDAVLVWRASAARYDEIGGALAPREQRAYDRDCGAAYAALGEAQAADLAYRGRLMTNEQILALFDLPSTP